MIVVVFSGKRRLGALQPHYTKSVFAQKYLPLLGRLLDRKGLFRMIASLRLGPTVQVRTAECDAMKR